MDAEKTLLLRKRQRQALLMNSGKALDKANNIGELKTPADVEKSQTVLAKLTDYRSQFPPLNDEVLVEIEDEQQALLQIQQASDYDDRILEACALLAAKIDNFSKPIAARPLTPNGAANHSFGGDHRAAAVHLPKLNINRFNGDPLKWQEFWDTFDNTIHDNADLSNIDKFKYLRTFLAGDAFRLIDGYRLTADNYDSAVAILQERFGDKQLAVFAHFEAMLALPVVNHDSHQLQSTYDECERHIRSLIALGLPEETFGQVFTPIILSKLPLFVKMELHRRNGAKTWTLQNLRDLLKDEIRAREMSHWSFGGSGDRNPHRNRDDKQQHVPQQPHQRNGGRPPGQFGSRMRGSPATSSHLLADTAMSGIRCNFCGENHYADQCKKYPDVLKRKDFMKGRCYLCLGSGHMASNCQSSRNCAHCKKTSHHRSLCPTKFPPTTVSRPDTSLTMDVSAVSRGMTTVNSTLLSHGEQVMLQTALAHIRGSQESPTTQARLLFDTGCSRTFVTERVASRIKARSKGTEVISVAGFSDSVRRTDEFKAVEFDIVFPNGSQKTLSANVIKTISCPIQRLPIDPQKYPVINQLVLAEPIVKKAVMVEIDILIGTDFYYDFVGGEQIRCSDGLIFVSSSFGFIATGRIDGSDAPTRDVSAMHLTCTGVPDDAVLHVERFWSIEDIGVKEPSTVDDDEEAMQMFNNTVKFQDGRYYVDLPLKSDAPTLPDNEFLARARLKSTFKRISEDGAVQKLYNQTIQDQLQKGIIEYVPAEPTGDMIHYIPHHCVITPGKATTKLRIVYDASAKASKSSPSLNECLHRGPVILDDLCGLLMRFRLSPIGIVGDIEKAFLQVGLLERSRDVTRFLWVKDLSLPPTGKNVVVLRFCRVPFGYICSPFLLGAVIRRHIDDSSLSVADDIRGNIYVDNIIVGKNAIGDAEQFYTEAKALFSGASMNLREWYTNSLELKNHIPEEDRGTTITTKVLGLLWDTENDTMSCSSFSVDAEAVNTKRLMLKYLAKVFDPCGYFSAVTVVGKLLIQKLWAASYGWDDLLPQPLIDEWKQCSVDLQRISQCKIDRCVSVDAASKDVTYELHCFTDASARAYAAVVYLRVLSGCESTVKLIFAKSRLAPIKAMTIPRLELMGVLIGTRVTAFVAKQLRLPIVAKYLWSDSQCVLHWIVKKCITATFVKNRIQEITQHDIKFRYVPTDKNPADLSSRGCSFDGLLCNDLWWYGPAWLLRDEEYWPADIDKSKVTSDDTTEICDVVPQTVLVIIDSDDLLVAERFSSLNRLIRVTAWIQRFVNNCRRRYTRSGTLSAEELAGARRLWDLRTQKLHFGEILNNKNSKKPSLVKQLDLFVDALGLIRCGGRFNNAELSEDAQRPVLLPKHCHYTDLVISDVHRRLHHAGVAHTLAQVRYAYWIVHGRGQVKRLVRDCLVCKKVRGRLYPDPPAPPLPDFRACHQRPFSAVGIDYMGPLFIKAPDGPKKVWIALFTCTVVRAIHLEVVEQLSTEQFLMCLRRFVAKHGRPRLIVSDNAKHFHTADRTFNKLWRDAQFLDDVQDFAANNQIKWKFIPEYAPWMGGFYERMVGIAKSSLKKSLDNRCVTLMELQTVVVEVTAIVNSRPLVYSEADPSASPLTPAHFLGGPQVGFPQFNLDEDTFNMKPTTADNLIQDWRRIQAMLNSFWEIWRSQYLMSLRQSAATAKRQNVTSDAPVIGDVVLIKDALTKHVWKLAIVMELYKSRDGFCRSVSLRLPSRKIIRRPIRLLFPLEMQTQVDPNIDMDPGGAPGQANSRPRRTAALLARRRVNDLVQNKSEDLPGSSESD